MPKSPRFTKRQASRLMAFLSAPERPEGTMDYCELSGFLFAVACSPDPIMPSEWLPLVFDEQGGGYKDQKEAQEVMADLMALYNKINDGALKMKPALPPGCEPRPEGIHNFERDAPLWRWSRGFGDGHARLEDVWNEFIPPELDQEAGLALLLLTFFADRRAFCAGPGKRDNIRSIRPGTQRPDEYGPHFSSLFGEKHLRPPHIPLPQNPP